MVPASSTQAGAHAWEVALPTPAPLPSSPPPSQPPGAVGGSGRPLTSVYPHASW